MYYKRKGNFYPFHKAIKQKGLTMEEFRAYTGFECKIGYLYDKKGRG